MNLDKTTDVVILKYLLSKVMVRLVKDIPVRTGSYKKGDWYFINYFDDHVEIWLDSPQQVLELTWDEADEFLEEPMD